MKPLRLNDGERLRHREKVSTIEALLDTMCDYMMHRLEKPLNTSALCHISGLTSHQIEYWFVKKFGVTPVKWFEQKLLEERGMS